MRERMLAFALLYLVLLLLAGRSTVALQPTQPFFVPTTTAPTTPLVLPSSQPTTPHLIFPGGGIFFYWQAGFVTYLRESGYDLSQISATGASAGALCATLAVTGVDYYQATDLALSKAEKAGVWERGSLQGIWGPMIDEWLDELLPHDADSLANQRLSLLVTPVPSFGKKKVCSFADRSDLISCNMASVHIPWFLDSKLTRKFRNHDCIDGSFLAKRQTYLSPEATKHLVVDYNEDPKYRDRALLDFVDAVSPKGIYQMLEDGKKYAKMMEEQGAFEAIPRRIE